MRGKCQQADTRGGAFWEEETARGKVSGWGWGNEPSAFETRSSVWLERWDGGSIGVVSRPRWVGFEPCLILSAKGSHGGA